MSSNLGNKETMAKNIKYFMELRSVNSVDMCRILGVPQSTFSYWLNAKTYPRIDKIEKMANYFGVSKSDLVEERGSMLLKEPSVSDDLVSVPIIGEVAAGYDSVINADGSESISLPKSWLRGRPVTDFFMLHVSGESMYPLYQDGDIVLVLRQTTMNHSGQIGVVLYEDEHVTLKRIEYVYGEDWMKLIPVNPQFPPVVVRDEALEHCRVLGIPQVVIRRVV